MAVSVAGSRTGWYRVPGTGVLGLNRIANLLLIALLAYTIAQLVWRLAPHDAPTPAAPTTPALGPAASSMTGREVGRIVGAHLYGRAATAPVSRNDDLLNAPRTHLDLALKGIMFTEHPQDSMAIIAAGKGRQVAYALGAKIPGGAVLQAMFADRVILNRGGHLETLFLSKKAPRHSAAPATTAGGVIDHANDPSMSQFLGNLRHSLIEHPELLGRMVRVEPVRNDGTFVGFRLVPGQEPRLFARVGLQPGDVVTSVNGIRIDAPQKGFQVMNDLASDRQIRVSILRHGMPLNMIYQIGR